MIPESTTVLVIGGGPGGSYASTLLAREGINVVLLEAAKHPREHVGESMLPSFRHYLRFVDLEDKFVAHGFQHKPGACFTFRDQDVCFTDFSLMGPGKTSWNLLRSESDELMLNHAASQGVAVFQETRVESITFDGTRPVSADWKDKQGQSGTIAFDWLIDASGRQGLISTKYLKNRIYREGLRNVAVYGYWTDVKIVDPEGGRRHNCPWFEAMNDKSGWCWLIPLHNGTTSIGVVMHHDTSNAKKAQNPAASLTDHYMEQLKLCPGIIDLIGDKGTFIEGGIKATSDYSYHATAYSGDHYRLVGDAAAFVDPFFSSGVHVAMTGALSAASTILGSMNGQLTETEAQKWHDAKIGICQTRFLLAVLSAYRQMQHIGNSAVLEDINIENFDAAFELFRPVYQGEHDSSTSLTIEGLNKMIDFTRHLFNPTTHEQMMEVRARVAPSLVALNGPLMGPADLDKVIDSDDSDAKQVLQCLNSLKVLRNDVGPESFTSETLQGYTVMLERGKLGMVKT